LAGVGVVVAVLAGVEDAGDGLEGVFGDLGADGGLAAGLVPQDGDVEGLEQAGFDPGREVGQDVPGERELVEQGQVSGGGHGLGEAFELGFEPFAFFAEFGDPGADAGAQGGGGGVGRVGGEFFEFEDLGVLRGLDPADAGLDRGDLGRENGKSPATGPTRKNRNRRPARLPGRDQSPGSLTSRASRSASSICSPSGQSSAAIHTDRRLSHRNDH
jgi:hypothetical protein